MSTENGTITPLSDSSFQYRVMSIDHLPKLKSDMERLKASGNISDNETFLSYIDGKVNEIPGTFLDAKYLIAMAVFTPIARATFEYNGTNQNLIIPHQYYESGVTRAQLEATIRKRITKDENCRIEMAHRDVFLKQVAVRSGLGKYGRNNLCYVNEMGSLITLHAFWTDFEFDRDDWTEVQMMDECKTCKICLNNCPTKAIRQENFVIDAGRCVSLYNEVAGEFPDWIPKSAHNALMGCMRCQEKCPANRNALLDIIELQTVVQDETLAILKGDFNVGISESLSAKLRGFTPATSDEYFPIFTRNLSVLLNK